MFLRHIACASENLPLRFPSTPAAPISARPQLPRKVTDMQLSSTPSILPGGCYGTRPAASHTSPIAVSSFGTLRIGHALNGISYTDHQLLSPVGNATAHFSGSLDDAIEGAQQLLARTELDDAPRGILALIGLGGSWDARVVYADPSVLQVVDHGTGTGGIASVEFTQASRSLGALVTSQGVLTPRARQSA